MRYILSPKLEKEVGNTLRETMGWVALERRPVLPGADSDGQTDIFMPGGGLAKAFHNMWYDITSLLFRPMCCISYCIC